MKIAIVSNTKWSVFNFRLGLLQHLSKTGSRVTIISPPDKSKSKYKSIPFVNIKEVTFSRRSINPLRDIKLWLDLLREFKKNHYDYVINYTIKPAIYSSLACRILKIPCITVITGLGFSFHKKKSIIRSIVETLYRLSLKKTSHVLFLNQDDLNTFRDNGLISQKSGMILPSEGINTKHFSFEPIADRDYTKFLFIGRLLKDKGIEDYTDAARKFLRENSKAKFSILGAIDPDSPSSISKETLDAWTQEGVINHIGFVNDVREEIRSHHCIVLPSYYKEGIPRSLLEALSMGRIIITTRSVGCKDVLREGKNGYFCETKNPSSLADTFEKVCQLSNSDLSSMGKFGREFVQSKFSEEIIVGIYQELMNGESKSQTKG